MGIKSLQGMEYFTALQTLERSCNNLTSLDISKTAVCTDVFCVGVFGSQQGGTVTVKMRTEQRTGFNNYFAARTGNEGVIVSVV